MKLLDKIKKGFKTGSKKVTEVTADLVEKGKETGGESLESAKEVFAQFGEKASEVNSAVKLKLELSSLQKSLQFESLYFGNLILAQYRTGNINVNEELLLNQFKKMVELEQQIQSRDQAYNQIRKGLSDDYVVNKLSDELSASGAVIEQVIVSEKSNVVDKLLREILLPKETLISAVKRGNDVLIPDGNTKLMAGDQVTFIGKTDDVKKIARRFTAS